MPAFAPYFAPRAFTVSPRFHCLSAPSSLALDLVRAKTPAKWRDAAPRASGTFARAGHEQRAAGSIELALGIYDTLKQSADEHMSERDRYSTYTQTHKHTFR
eukprot:478140-Pleurochrysis_carterae.AAC.3